MSDYLDNFGVADARREKRNKRIVYSLLTLIIAGGALWFLFRNYREESRIREFLSMLSAKDYKSAYALWGCTEATPCRDYQYEKFLNDWGPQSDAAAGAVERTTVKTCDKGIIQVLKVKGQEVNLFVDTGTLQIGYSPWPVCNPRVQL